MASFAIHTLLSMYQKANTKRAGLLRQKKEISSWDVEYLSDRSLMLASVIGAYKPTLAVSILLKSHVEKSRFLNEPIPHSSASLKEPLAVLLSIVNALKQNTDEGQFFVWKRVWDQVFTLPRFGDPEAQVILPRMQSDLADLLEASTRGKLAGRDVSWHRGACVCVVVASEGYPGSYPSGKEIRGIAMAAEGNDILLFHAGTTFDENRLLTSGGRVLGVVARAVSLDEAIAKSYEGVNRIHFDGMYYRRDIAAKGLAKLRGKTS